jgi:hypothetical protein
MRKPAWPLTTTIHASRATKHWQPLVTPEQLALMPPKLREPTTILGVAVEEAANLLTLHELIVTLNDPEFMERMSRTTAHQAIHNVIVSIFSSIYIGLDALFSGTKEGSVDIKRAINVVWQQREPILAFHAQTSPEARKDADRMIRRLTQLKSRLGRGRVAAAFSHVHKMRNNRLAHFDYKDGQSVIAIEIHHIQICLVNVGRIIDLLCRTLIQRTYNISEMRKLACQDAENLRDALLRGAAGVPSATSSSSSG